MADADIASRVETAWPVRVWRDLNVVVAVSGGSDSVALLRILRASSSIFPGKGRLCVAHFDHRTREDSSSDLAWVRELSGQLGLDFEAGISVQSGQRSEEQLRNERHTFFAEVAHKTGARYLATGHTADDQIETVLFRLFRGTGIEGLGGLDFSRPLGHATTLVRPLLRVSRQEAIRHLESLGQTYRTDPSNASTEPTRNWIRHELLPLVETRFGPGVREAIARLASQANDSQAVVCRLAEEALERSRVPSAAPETPVVLRAAELEELDRAVAIGAIRLAWRQAGLPERAVTARHWQELLAVARGESPAAALPGSLTARRDGELLRIEPAR